jgi:hypothetical protein
VFAALGNGGSDQQVSILEVTIRLAEFLEDSKGQHLVGFPVKKSHEGKEITDVLSKGKYVLLKLQNVEIFKGDLYRNSRVRKKRRLLDHDFYFFDDISDLLVRVHDGLFVELLTGRQVQVVVLDPVDLPLFLIEVLEQLLNLDNELLESQLIEHDEHVFKIYYSYRLFKCMTDKYESYK